MARRHDRQARDFGPGPSPESTGTLREARASAANDNRKSGPSYTSALPCDALAFIEPVPMAVKQAGRERADMWRLSFAEQIGRASCGDRVGQYVKILVVAVTLNKKQLETKIIDINKI